MVNPNRNKNDMNTHKVKRPQNSDTKLDNREPKHKHRLETVSDDLQGFKLHSFTGPTSLPQFLK